MRLSRWSGAIAWAAIAVMLVSLIAAIAHGQCSGGICPSRPPSHGWRPSVPGDSYPQPAGSICRIYCAYQGTAGMGTGTLVAKGGDWGAVLTCAHLFRGRVGRITVRFPDGQSYGGQLAAKDDRVDLAVVKITPRPEAPIVKIAEDYPRQGELLWFGGYGPQGRYRVVWGRLEGYLAGQTGRHYNLVVTGGARQGDSGGPVFNTQGKLVGVVWGTDGHRSMAVYNGQICAFTALVDRYLFPWNADLAKQKYRQENPPVETQPAPPSTRPGIPSEPSAELAAIRAALDQLRGELRDNQNRIGALEEVTKAAQAAAAKAETEAGKAIAEALDLNEAAQRVAAQAAEAHHTAGEASNQAAQVQRAVEALDQGLIGRVTELVKGLLGRYLGISFGGGGLLVGLLLWLVRKDILDRVRHGDPLLVERLAARTSTTLDDRLIAAAETIGERIAERLGRPPDGRRRATPK